MDSLIFSLNATIPIFLVMVIGYCLKYTRLITPDFVKSLNQFNYTLTLPVLLFMDISTADFYSVWDTTYVLYCFFVTLFCVLAIWLIAGIVFHLLGKHNHTDCKAIVGEFVQASYRGSAAVLGIAFIENIYGTSVIGPLMILGTVPLYNIMAVIVLSFTSPDNQGLGKAQLKKTLLGILTNPIIISILLGLLFSLLRLRLPFVISKSLHMISQLATPLALLTLGAGFEGRKALAKIKPTIAASFIKLMVQPALFLLPAVMLGFRNEQLVALLVMLGAPTTVSSHIMAKNMNHEGVLTSSVVVATTFLSSITMTFWLFLLRYMNYV